MMLYILKCNKKNSLNLDDTINNDDVHINYKLEELIKFLNVVKVGNNNNIV